MLKNNPAGLGSINDPDDVVDILSCTGISHIIKGLTMYCMMNGLCVMTGCHSLVCAPAWLEVSHLYPNSKGGANISKNLLIAPKLINRMLKDTIPRYTPEDEFRGFIAASHEEPVKTTLLKALTSRYGVDTVQIALKGFGI
jgi:hypothetical protein